MMKRGVAGVMVVAVAGLVGWGLVRAWPHLMPTRTRQVVAAPVPPGRKIKARLFYVSEDGRHLSPVDREVAFGEQVGDQAREILLAQLAPAVPPLVSAIPAGTTLRHLFVTERGDAYVDLSEEVSKQHSGGTADELLTVYAVVNALAVNLPGIHAVQILVNGQEAATLAGHVDLRRPIAPDLARIQ